MNPNLTLADLISLEGRMSQYMVGSHLYPAVAAYFRGIEHADGDVLRGFGEFVSVTYERTTQLGWESAMLPAWGLRAGQVGLLRDEPGTPEAHAAAIRGLFSALREFADIVDAGQLDAVLAEFATLEPTL